MRVPGLRLHALKGDLKGYWAVTVKANWRILFRFEGSDVHDVELIDYHRKKEENDADEESPAPRPVGED